LPVFPFKKGKRLLLAVMNPYPVQFLLYGVFLFGIIGNKKFLAKAQKFKSMVSALSSLIL
jgi:hypothetical protein